MQKKKLLSLFLACVLCLSCFCVSASASGEGTVSPRDGSAINNPQLILANGRSYKVWCTLEFTYRFRASVSVQQQSGLITLPGAVRYQAYLYDGNGKLRQSSTIVKYVSGNFPSATTDYWQGDSAFGAGWVEIMNSDGDFEKTSLPPTAVVSLTRSAADIDSTMEMLKGSLDENGQYPVNLSGESYGSALLVEIVGDEPDLIEAVGVDGVNGYVYTEDLHADYDVPIGEDVLIPLYDVNGVEISSFLLHGVTFDDIE